MTPQEAIKTLKECTVLACEYHIKNRCERDYEEREKAFQEVKKIAIEAIKKQMVKKRPARKHRFAELYIGYCPCCLEGINSEMEHCDKCGQALNWSEV